MTKFKCPCKYTYDPEKGDPKQNIPPGTPFEGFISYLHSRFSK
jgi:rubredoxin